MRVHPAVGSTDRPDASERRPERQLSSACLDPTVPPPSRQRSTSWAQLGHSLRSLGQAAAPSLMRAPSSGRQSIKAGSMQALDKALDEIGIGEDFAVGAMLGTKGIDDAFDESDGSSNFLFASFLVRGGGGGGSGAPHPAPSLDDESWDDDEDEDDDEDDEDELALVADRGAASTAGGGVIHSLGNGHSRVNPFGGSAVKGRGGAEDESVELETTLQIVVADGDGEGTSHPEDMSRKERHVDPRSQ